jgi:hypothetical protein
MWYYLFFSGDSIFDYRLKQSKGINKSLPRQLTRPKSSLKKIFGEFTITTYLLILNSTQPCKIHKNFWSYDFYNIFSGIYDLGVNPGIVPPEIRSGEFRCVERFDVKMIIMKIIITQ